ncbi:NAD synthetase [Oryzomicrobium terrae]|uniref:Glutamine-dependent NAD(+) synthetase n=1 Tax=Oryzomicrobium terrae TaxID=1735038 RepID=A0A5C1E5W4_9RHOO|nr:NAD+ synthase [Oryzomicrobium terrae]QEL64326.1 NAD synthetase [Oryzomicrobium terrae]
MASLRLAIAQLNITLGDLAGNAERILAAARRAADQGVRLVLTPELSLTGYPPEDLLLRPDFYRACDRAVADLAARLPAGVAVVVGHPVEIRGERFNAASIVDRGALRATYLKRRLPNSTVFDEVRYFSPGPGPLVADIDGVKVGLAICEDVWFPEPCADLAAAGAELILVPNASPYHLGKGAERLDVIAARARETDLPLVYANLVGGQDELVFDGGSWAVQADGTAAARAPQFEEDLLVLDYAAGRLTAPPPLPDLSLEDEVYRALVLGVRDYLGKNGFPGAIIGLSGGIDSALTLCVAVDALGADKVRAVMMPSPYTADISLEDSRALVRTLGVQYDEIPIAPAMATMEGLLAPLFAGLAADTTEENIQARIRGNLLMALSNKTGRLVLTTGNKSEMAVGYCTLYGDMAGGFAVIKDIAKTLVYRLCRWINREREIIPTRIITRPPSAELKPNQLDQDSLPPYEVLDAIIEAYVENNRSPREIIAAGYAEADVRRVVRLLKIAEYKRRQSPLGIRVTRRGFGKDWRVPITNRYADEY